MDGVQVFRDLSISGEIENSFGDITTRNRAYIEVLKTLLDIARSHSIVLITGETGTGKELVATALHNLSPRKDKPLITVDCNALPETLLEAEIFGYRRGAFTDAKEDRPGRFELAEGGTIFLDEIGNIPLAVQAKLLGVLDKKEYQPLRGIRTQKADVRIISATNKDLWSSVREGSFREDLYYRLNVFPIKIPPLRERKEDIPLLIDHFLARLNAINGRSILGCTEPALEILLSYDYPGNVRELQNFVEYAFNFTKSDYIDVESLPPGLKSNHHTPGRLKPGQNLRQAVSEFERELILEILRKHNGNVARAAEETGMHRATLYRKIKKLKNIAILK